MNGEQRLPKLISGVYFLYSEEEIVYVGQSVNIYARIGSHAAKGIEFDSWAWREIKDAATRIKEESAEILKHAPKFNIRKGKDWAGYKARLAAESERSVTRVFPT